MPLSTLVQLKRSRPDTGILDSSIKRLTVMINRDQENDCDSSSQWTRDNMIKLTSACNNYISTLKKLQEGATTKEHQEKRKTA